MSEQNGKSVSIDLMRRLDLWAGVLICALLTLHRRAVEGFRRLAGRWSDPAIEDGNNPPAVLLVKLAEMGTTVMALPAFQKLRERYPGVRLHYLCFAENRAVLDLIPEIPLEVHTIRTSSLSALLKDSLAAVRRLRRLKLDGAVDMEIFSRGAAALTYLSGARVRVGHHRFHAEGLYCGDLYTHRLSYSDEHHTAVSFLKLAEAAARPPDEVPMLKKRIVAPGELPESRPGEGERETILGKLAKKGYSLEERPPILVLNPNAGDLLPLRRWPLASFEALARRCLESHEHLRVVVTGSPAEADEAERFAGKIGHRRLFSLAGETTLRELIALYSLSSVLITNDSGPAHFSALTPIDTIVLFGPETPRLYRPLGRRIHPLTAGLACSPCISAFNQRRTPCRDNRCMQEISVDRVFETFGQVFGNRS